MPDHKLRDFHKVFSNGHKIVAKTFILFYLYSSSQLPSCQYGVIASKRIGKAVVRNKCKRRLRAALHLFKNKEKSRVILIARNSLVNQPFDELVGSIDWALRKAHDLTIVR